MRFKIVYDKPGRLRVRAGGYAFERESECSIYTVLRKLPYVTMAEVHSENGGILVLYKEGSREQVLEVLAALDTRTLPKAEPSTEYQVTEIDADFKRKLFKMVFSRTLRHALLPTPVEHFFSVMRGCGFVWRGLKTLFSGRLTVEVLDGASIAACMLQKDISTSGNIMFLLKISALLEDYTHARARASLTDSLAIKVDKVWRVRDGVDELIPMAELARGEFIRVRTGSVIPVDGEVFEGEASVNESSMTGEPLAAHKTAGSTVFAGTVVEEGSIVVKVREISSGTKISKIIELIDNSENLKAGVQSRAEQLADKIVPFSFIGFGLTLLLTRNVTKAVSVLMVDYSCAIKLSTPISVISAIREAAEHDITVKGGKFLEEVAQADTIVFDKTGTLTEAEPHLEKVIAFGGRSEDEVLKFAACLEEHFPHSVARAVVRGAAEKGLLHSEEHTEVHYIVAHGIASSVYGKRAVIGSRHFVVEDEGVKIPGEAERRIEEEAKALSCIYLAVGGELAGVLCISDPPRPEARLAIDALRKMGLEHVVMLTGDSKHAAERTAELLGIGECYSQVLPEQKHSVVEQLKAAGRRVIMVGDGINDAPALAVANVSIAMSDATDIAKETADITLRSADLMELAELRRLSELLFERINKNFKFIFWFNSSLLACGLLGVLAPGTSALLHNVSTMGICAWSMLPLLKDD